MHEAREQEVRIQQFIDAGRDEYDLKQQVRFSPDASKWRGEERLMVVGESEIGVEGFAQDDSRLPQEARTRGGRSSHLHRKFASASAGKTEGETDCLCLSRG